MILGLLIFLLTLATKVGLDVDQYRKGQTIDHGKEAILVFLALLVASFCSGWASALMWYFGFWVLFDGIFNLFIKQKWGYIGTTAWIDRMQHKYPWIIWARYIGLAASIAVFIIYRY